MHKSENALKHISEKTMLRLANDDIVLPSKYLETFMEEQKRLDTGRNEGEEHTKVIRALEEMEYRLFGVDAESTSRMNGLISDVRSLQRYLFSDDLTKARNRLWLFKHKLHEDGTFSDSGFIVSSRVIGHIAVVKEYGPDVGDVLLRQIYDHMAGYMKEHHLEHEIVRYRDDSFLLFIAGKERSQVQVDEEMLNLHKGMEGYTFRHRNRVFNFTFLFAVMQYLKHEPFSLVIDQLDEKLFEKGL
ncbi:diguanylate cyclase [Sulfurovum riftiae]|uniref:GGDEF domain-containing protein n=1 Tax=Sulfurovum riftiae TaxID=1630136 RepID=A0A151CE09_9BACT|nr:diguanylate cyclase [Sulfurovum riftiae]KYJ85745.1 hypothetical protein AS592_03125 [Sulfurovum riftiae]